MSHSPNELYASAAEALARLYPQHKCALEYDSKPWRLVVMARLSAQCTDARVNIVCKELFSKYPTVEALAHAAVTDVEDIIRPCGLFRTKARDIVAECAMILQDFGGQVPSSMESLLAMPGVGRKIANLIRGDIFGMGGVVCDTHFMRICGRLGFYDTALKDPVKIERIMEGIIPREEQSAFCHRIVEFGRQVCTAKSPDCEHCPVELCGMR